MFGVFLFLTYYMQQTLGFSPLTTGLAFLPMIAVIMPTGAIGQTRLVPRFGARRLVTLGMAARRGRDAALHRRHASTPATSTHVLPGLMVMGLGLGLIMAPAMSTATLGVDRRDAGVASAMVNTGQQIGGSIGTALLSTLASSAATTTERATPQPPTWRPRPRSTATRRRSPGRPRIFAVGAAGLVAAAAERRPRDAGRGRRRAGLRPLSRPGGAGLRPRSTPARDTRSSAQVPAVHAPIGNPWTPRRATASPPRARS